jgi:hypothetical protein
MRDRGALFLFSILALLAALGGAACLAATGDLFTQDGFFLFLMCLTAAFSFGLYIRYEIAAAIEEARKLKARTAVDVRSASSAQPEGHLSDIATQAR